MDMSVKVFLCLYTIFRIAKTQKFHSLPYQIKGNKDIFAHSICILLAMFTFQKERKILLYEISISIQT